MHAQKLQLTVNWAATVKQNMSEYTVVGISLKLRQQKFLNLRCSYNPVQKCEGTLGENKEEYSITKNKN